MPRTVVWVSWRDEAGFVHSACVGGELIGDLLQASDFAETSCGLTVPSLAKLEGERPTCVVCLEGYEERLGMVVAAWEDRLLRGTGTTEPRVLFGAEA